MRTRTHTREMSERRQFLHGNERRKKETFTLDVLLYCLEKGKCVKSIRVDGAETKKRHNRKMTSILNFDV